MNSPAPFLSPSEAARQLGVSPKALRLYEQLGLMAPVRTGAGWRAYGPGEMARATEVVALRALGLSLAQIAHVLAGDPIDLGTTLAAHQAALESQLCQLAGTVEKVRGLRTGLAQGQAPAAGELVRLLDPAAEPCAAFDLPWPWCGERFELRGVRPLTYIIGPLGSGKTRLARCLTEALPGAVFLGLDRLADGDMVARALLDADPVLATRVNQTLAWLFEDGATASAALTVLLARLEADGPDALVIDMVEQGLGGATQEALIAHLRRHGPGGRPLFLLTRSSSILDLEAVGTNEAIILCPANHSPPTFVAAHPGAPGYEAVATCLASSEVRARTQGVIAWRPQVA